MPKRPPLEGESKRDPPASSNIDSNPHGHGAAREDVGTPPNRPLWGIHKNLPMGDGHSPAFAAAGVPPGFMGTDTAGSGLFRRQ